MCHVLDKNDLKLQPYKKTKSSGLDRGSENCKSPKMQLLAWIAGDGIIFSDEKLFLLQKIHPDQND
jgi:hypothetical protein